MKNNRKNLRHRFKRNHYTDRKPYQINYAQLSKAMAYFLRHNPQELYLELDPDGSVPLADFLGALRNRKGFMHVTRDDIVHVVNKDGKKRFAIENGKIKALYGHSVKITEFEEIVPPEILYHGTLKSNLENIKKDGLTPQTRQKVHLSVRKEDAMAISRRHGTNTVILKINARQANEDGIKFYKGSDTVLLSDTIPPAYIEVVETDE